MNSSFGSPLRSFCMATRRIVSVFRKPGICRCFSARRQNEVTMNVFDRKAKRRQKNRAALMENVEVYDYLKDEVRIIRRYVRIVSHKSSFLSIYLIWIGVLFMARLITQSEKGLTRFLYRSTSIAH